MVDKLVDKLRVFVDPRPASLSRAMYRVSKALARYAPDEVAIVDGSGSVDVQVLHSIDAWPDRHKLSGNVNYAVIQYCYKTARGATDDLMAGLWQDSLMVWSYYDLHKEMYRLSPDTPFYLAPLGVDDVFKQPPSYDDEEDIGLVTTGYVDGPGAEALAIITQAAIDSGLSCVHVGGDCLDRQFGYSPRWRRYEGVSDEQLRDFYCQALWVSGLRHVEGFELPVIEGLACGARPIVFDRPDTRLWYGGLADFVADDGSLIDSLMHVFSFSPDALAWRDQELALERFDWQIIAEGFWDMLLRACHG